MYRDAAILHQQQPATNNMHPGGSPRTPMTPQRMPPSPAAGTNTNSQKSAFDLTRPNGTGGVGTNTSSYNMLAGNGPSVTGRRDSNMSSSSPAAGSGLNQSAAASALPSPSHPGLNHTSSPAAPSPLNNSSGGSQMQTNNKYHSGGSGSSGSGSAPVKQEIVNRKITAAVVAEKH